MFSRVCSTAAALGHPLLVLRLLHSLGQLVRVAQHLLLLLPEPLELLADLFPLFLGLGFLQADCSSFSRSFRSFCRRASSRSRLSTCGSRAVLVLLAAGACRSVS